MRKKNRLSGAEIRALTSPRRFHGDLFSLSYFPSTADTPRFACVVSKKVAGSAVKRNRIKRRVRAVLDAHQSVARVGSYVWYVKKDAVGAPYRDIEKDIVQLLSRIDGARGTGRVQ